jgi:DNA transformation protein
MSASAEFTSHVRELLAPMGPLGGGRFFGGHAIKHQGHQFAMVMGNTLYLRVSATSRPEFEKRGCQPFIYSTQKGTVQVRKYYTAPEELLDDPPQLLAWARHAIQAAQEG